MVYFDNAATTPVPKAVADAMYEVLTAHFGNPSSQYPIGVEMKKAVECGYWNLFRYDPRRKAEGKNPFQMDSKAPTGDYQAFLKNEVRYSALMRTYPERASRLFDRAEVNAIGRHERLLQWEALSGKLVAAEAEEVEREAASRRAEAEKQ